MSSSDRTREVQDPIVGSSLADEIAFRAQTAILDGELPPGTKLHQDDLSARWGVSRTPVREALRILQARGLVDMIPNRGATVSLPKRAEVRDTYAVRAQLEGYACELAASRVRDSDIEVFDAAQKELSDLIAELKAGPDQLSDNLKLCQDIAVANARFHRVIHEASLNSRLKTLIEDLQAMFPTDYLARAIGTPEAAVETYLDEHEAIQAALVERDGQLARRLMIDHIESGGARLLEYLDEQGFWKPD